MAVARPPKVSYHLRHQGKQRGLGPVPGWSRLHLIGLPPSGLRQADLACMALKGPLFHRDHTGGWGAG